MQLTEREKEDYRLYRKAILIYYMTGYRYDRFRA